MSQLRNLGSALILKEKNLRPKALLMRPYSVPGMAAQTIRLLPWNQEEI